MLRELRIPFTHGTVDVFANINRDDLDTGSDLDEIFARACDIVQRDVIPGINRTIQVPPTPGDTIVEVPCAVTRGEVSVTVGMVVNLNVVIDRDAIKALFEPRLQSLVDSLYQKVAGNDNQNRKTPPADNFVDDLRQTLRDAGLGPLVDVSEEVVSLALSGLASGVVKSFLGKKK